MEDRFRDSLRQALERECISPADLARDVGMDKAYFVDLLAGRKKTVSATAFMLVCRRMNFDPWEMSGVQSSASRTPLPRSAPAREVSEPPTVIEQPKIYVPITSVIEEDAFREVSGNVEKSTFLPIKGFGIDRQSAMEIRGPHYACWGFPAASVVHVLSFPRYAAVASAGRLVVAARAKGDLREVVMRRIVVDGDGASSLVKPDGKRTRLETDADWSLLGLVVQSLHPIETH